MDPPEFPPNSKTSKDDEPEDKGVKKIVSGGATKRKRSLRKQFQETFVGGDIPTASQVVIFDVLLPMARDTIWEMGSQFLHSLMFGGGGRRGAGVRPPSGPMGNVQYNRMSRGPQLSAPARALSREARAKHNFDEIVLDQRTDAEDVIDKLFELVSQYGNASVADLYELLGLTMSHTDNKWGWTNLSGAGVSRVRNGYLLDLPEPRPLP